MVFEVMFEISIPFVMASLLDQGVQQRNMNNILFYGGLMLVCAFLSLFCGMQSARYGAYASAGFAKNLRRAIFKKVQTFSFENIDQFSSGGLVTRMMTDVTNVQNAYQMVIRICVRAPLNLIFAIVACFLINPEMAMIFVYVTIFLAAVLSIIMKIVCPLFTEVFEAYDNLNNSIQENITNMRVVKSYAKEADETVKFKKASRRIYKMFMRAIRVVIMSNPAMILSMYASFLMISWFGAHLIVVGKLSTGELTSMFSYTMTILMSLMMFMMIFVMLSISMASVERINEVLNTESTIVSPENGLTEVTDGSISFDHVDFSYTDENGDKTHVLKDISLDIKSGEVIGILGGTGSGKSTLLKLFLRQYDAGKEEILINGRSIQDYRIKDLRALMGYVPQEQILFAMSIKDNIRFGNPTLSDDDVVEATKICGLYDDIMAMAEGFDTLIGEKGVLLSGGQKQRLSIARAFLRNRECLILDDALSAVDAKTEREIISHLQEERGGCMNIISAHRLSAIRHADEIIVMNEGRISERGSHEKLLAQRGWYYEQYLIQEIEEEIE